MTSPEARRPSATADRLPLLVSRIGGAFLVAFGVWAMVAPESFFDTAASFEPYNQHFVQDIGAFQIGLGAVLLLAGSAVGDGLAAGLLGVGIGAAAHLVSHVVGRDLGGKPETDIPVFAVLAGLLLAAGVIRLRNVGRST